MERRSELILSEDRPEGVWVDYRIVTISVTVADHFYNVLVQMNGVTV